MRFLRRWQDLFIGRSFATKDAHSSEGQWMRLKQLPTAANNWRNHSRNTRLPTPAFDVLVGQRATVADIQCARGFRENRIEAAHGLR